MPSSSLLKSVLKRNAHSLPASFTHVEAEPFVPMILGDGSILPQSAVLEQLTSSSLNTHVNPIKPHRPLSYHYHPDPHSRAHSSPSVLPSPSKLARPPPEPDFTSVFFWSIHTGTYGLPVADVTEEDIELSISIGLAARARLGEGSREERKPVVVETEEREPKEETRKSLLKPLLLASKAKVLVVEEPDDIAVEEVVEEKNEIVAAEATHTLPIIHTKRTIPSPLTITVTPAPTISNTSQHLSISTSSTSFTDKPELSPCSLLDTYFTLDPLNASPLSPEPTSPISPSGCSFIVDLYFDPLSPDPSPSSASLPPNTITSLPPSPAPSATSFDLDAYFSPLPSPAASEYSFTIDLYVHEDRDEDEGRPEDDEGSDEEESEGLVTPPGSPSKNEDLVLAEDHVEVVASGEATQVAILVSDMSIKINSALLPPLDISSRSSSRRGSLDSDGTTTSHDSSDSFESGFDMGAISSFPLPPTCYTSRLDLPLIVVQAPTPPRQTAPCLSPSQPSLSQRQATEPTNSIQPYPKADRRLHEPSFMPPSLSFLTRALMLSDIEEEVADRLITS